MMIYPLGLIIAFVSIALSIFHLRQSVLSYFDVVALLVVFGGTTAIAVITFPWECRTELKKSLKDLFTSRKRNPHELMSECMSIIQVARAGGAFPEFRTEGPAGDLLRDGAELLTLGFSPDKIEIILGERIRQASDRAHRVANAFRSLSKYPPAFGLVGTVLGLVSLMRTISDGGNSQETGLRMAVALVATLYGLLVSNLVINPAGEHILKFSMEDEKDGEIALQAILLASERSSLLEAQEMLNSYVDRKYRINILGGSADGAVSGEAGAAA
jgi:chemotaxis protein MotA